MDVLVEMTPGRGWLARENQRLVFLPNPESIDVAHDVIEPLLLPRDLDESFATLQRWISSSRPLPPMLMVALETSVRMMCHDFGSIDVVESDNSANHRVDVTTTIDPLQLGSVSSLTAGDHTEEASGMLVEGVVRAGGLQLHIHRGWGTDGPLDTVANLAMSALELVVGDETIVVGTGLVLGRWPYSSPLFDTSLEPVIVSDPAVSRLHAELRPTPEGVMLIDRGSHNGTWVIHGREHRTTTAELDVPIPVEPGDQIRVGDTVLELRGKST